MPAEAMPHDRYDIHNPDTGQRMRFTREGDDLRIDTEQFFRTYFELARRGELNAQGLPSLLQMAVLVPRFADEIRVTRPPWPVQRAVFALLRPLTWRRAQAARRTTPQ